MNPEFRRNLLLELTLHRLVAMPVILLLIYFAAWAIEDEDGVASIAMVLMVGMLILWGTRLAGDAVLGEVTGRTWDAQRMSALGPLSMTWGKLLGSTIFVWYGAALSIPAFLYSYESSVMDLVRVLMTGLFAQATALFTSLVIQRSRPQGMRFQVTFAQLVAIAAGFTYSAVLTDEFFFGSITWYGTIMASRDFAFYTGIAALAWVCFGIYRLMRGELQFRCWPVGWTAFVLFWAAYVGGFGANWFHGARVLGGDSIEPILRLSWTYILVVCLTWAAAYAEPKGFVRLRRWGIALRSGNPARILNATPTWAPALLAGLLLGLVLLATWGGAPDAREFLGGGLAQAESMGAFTVALMLFLLRDIGMIYFLTLDGRARRGHLMALVYLTVLYVILPLIMNALGFDDLLPMLVPLPHGNAAVIVLPILAQVGLMAGLLIWRWHRIARTMASLA